MVERSRTCSVAHPQEARGDGVERGCVEFVEVAIVVDEYGALQGLFGEGVVADAVVREVVEDFEGQEIARRGVVGSPVEDGAVDDFDALGMSARGGGPVEFGGLQRGERAGDLNDFEFRPRVDFWV